MRPKENQNYPKLTTKQTKQQKNPKKKKNMRE
jgi:hypothetical protein